MDKVIIVHLGENIFPYNFLLWNIYPYSFSIEINNVKEAKINFYRRKFKLINHKSRYNKYSIEKIKSDRYEAVLVIEETSLKCYTWQTENHDIVIYPDFETIIIYYIEDDMCRKTFKNSVTYELLFIFFSIKEKDIIIFFDLRNSLKFIKNLHNQISIYDKILKICQLYNNDLLNERNCFIYEDLSGKDNYVISYPEEENYITYFHNNVNYLKDEIEKSKLDDKYIIQMFKDILNKM